MPKKREKMSRNDFRDELIKIMPGYKWTVHRKNIYAEKNDGFLSATGIQTSGSNRLSTLEVCRRDKDNMIEYTAKSAGFGINAPWLAKHTDSTLARGLRGLQNQYESMASKYSGHASALRAGRGIKG